jgi:hypothetical protein
MKAAPTFGTGFIRARATWIGAARFYSTTAGGVKRVDGRQDRER